VLSAISRFPLGANMDPHIPITSASEQRPGRPDAPVTLGNQPARDTVRGLASALSDSSTTPHSLGWLRRTAVIGSVVLAIVATAAIGYRLWMARGERAKPAISEPAGGDPSPAKADGPSNAAPQVVTLSAESVRKYGLRIGTARKRTLVSRIVAPARVALNSEATAVIGVPVQGRAIAIPVRAGDRVEAGSVLLEIESTELDEAQSDYLQRQTAAVTARAAIKPLAEIFARVKKLYDESKLIGITEVQERELDLHKAQGAVATADAAVTAARNKLHLLGMDNRAIELLEKTGQVNSRYVVRSPLTGEVVERQVNPGELVKPDREKLFIVADTSTLWVWADVPEARVCEVAVGCPARVTTTAAGDRSFTGIVSYVASTIDDATRSLRVRIAVKSEPALRPGMFAQAEIDGKGSSENAEPVVAVPEAAIQTVNGSTAVFLPAGDSSNAFQPRPVSTGCYVDGMVGIISGLEEGERVVTAGSAILKAELLKSTAKDED
jgi:cobalt-zinc-cadmium efflux system membrane fusion protein